jgi:polyhydroxyalkanoate synthesis regulator phasin
MEIKKIFYAIVGALGEAAKQLAELNDEIAERGRLLRGNSDSCSERFVDKALGKPRDAGKIAGEILRDAADNLGLATTADIANLKARLAQIEKNLKKMKSAEKTLSTKKGETD